MVSEYYTDDVAPQVHMQLKLGEFLSSATLPESADKPKMCGNLLDSYSAERSSMPWFIR